MKTKHIIKSTSCAIAAATLLNGNAHAAANINFTLAKRLASAGEDIVIGEFTHGGTVGYEIDVANGVSLNAFAVSHSGDASGIVAPNGWNFVNVAKASWAGGSYGFAGKSGTSLGSFESLFGAVDTHVIVFTAPTQIISQPGMSFPGPPPSFIPIFIPGSTIISAGFLTDANSDANLADVEEINWSASNFVPRFQRGGFIASEFIALNASGTIIGQSIPEPSAVLLSGLGLLAALRRRR